VVVGVLIEYARWRMENGRDERNAGVWEGGEVSEGRLQMEECFLVCKGNSVDSRAGLF